MDHLIADLVKSYGENVIDEIVGTWIAKSHKQRARLFWSKPESRAHAPHYLAFVRELSCCRCGTDHCDPDHIGPRGLGRKTDDYRTIPLCRRCHELRHAGKLKDFDWRSEMIDVLVRYLRIVEQR